jgi:hypothetical protein
MQQVMQLLHVYTATAALATTAAAAATAMYITITHTSFRRLALNTMLHVCLSVRSNPTLLVCIYRDHCTSTGSIGHSTMAAQSTTEQTYKPEQANTMLE